MESHKPSGSLNHELFEQVVEAAPNAMVLTGADGRIVLVNAQTEKLFGYSRGELVGQCVDMLVPQRVRASHSGYRDTFYRDPTSRPMGIGRDLFAVRKDGSEFPVEIGLNPVRTSDEALVLAAIVDITERKRSQQELLQKTEELARSNQDLEQFAYVASHDLQEPLRAVAGPLQLLQRRYQGQLDERADEFIKHAVDGATRMQKLIDDLLAYSRVGRSAAEFQMTDCGAALDQALSGLSVVLHESGAQIHRGELPTVLAVPTQLTLLFQNLVGNALKFRLSDRPVHIEIGAQRQGNEWVISVKDNGIGIDAQYFERIFVIFQRLHSRAEYPGTGLGLALCKRIVEQHGGRIWVESMPGSGTTFFFTLNARGVHGV